MNNHYNKSIKLLEDLEALTGEGQKDYLINFIALCDDNQMSILIKALFGIKLRLNNVEDFFRVSLQSNQVPDHVEVILSGSAKDLFINRKPSTEDEIEMSENIMNMLTAAIKLN